MDTLPLDPNAQSYSWMRTRGKLWRWTYVRTYAGADSFNWWGVIC